MAKTPAPEQTPARLTPAQWDILLFIYRYTEKNSVAPTVQQICDAVHMKSKASVQYHLKRLRNRGYVLEGKPRSRSTGSVLTELATKILKDTVQSASEEPSSSLLGVPVLDSFDINLSLKEQEDINCRIPIPVQTNGEFFAIRANTRNGYGFGIRENDLLLVRQDMKPALNNLVLTYYQDHFCCMKMRTTDRGQDFYLLTGTGKRYNMEEPGLTILGVILSLQRELL